MIKMFKEILGILIVASVILILLVFSLGSLIYSLTHGRVDV